MQLLIGLIAATSVAWAAYAADPIAYLVSIWNGASSLDIVAIPAEGAVMLLCLAVASYIAVLVNKAERHLAEGQRGRL